MTKAQKTILEKLLTFGTILIQFEGGETFIGFNNGPAVNKRTFDCMVRDNLIVPIDIGLDGVALSYGRKDHG